MPDLFIHVGYPKTATTTFQKHVFPKHPDIDYLGKFIPSFRFCEEKLYPEIEKLMTTDSSQYVKSEVLQEVVERYRMQSAGKILLLSSESFIHVTAIDLGLVAQRIKDTFSPCKIIITIREQRDIIKSFYGMHGRFGQYLFLCKDEMEKVRIPLSMEDWLTYSIRAYDKSFLSILHYYETIECYCHLFGRENVGVFLFEEFVEDRDTYMKKFCEFLNIDFSMTMRLVEGKHEHPNLSRAELFYYRVMAKVLPKFRFEFATMNRSKLKLGFLGNPRKVTSRISAEWEKKLEMLYQEGNRKLISHFGLPVDLFNYLL